MTSLLLSMGTVAFAGTEAASAPPNLYGEAMRAIADGRITDAEKILAALTAAEPSHAGAWLDLAMLYCAAGNGASAGHLFTEIERRFAPPPAILEVMERQREEGCKGGLPKGDATLRLGRGFESNVNQGTSSPNFSFNNGISPIELVLLPEYLPRGDRFTQVSAELLHDFSRGGLTGLTGVVQFQSKQYDNLSSYSHESLFLGLDKPWQWGQWGLRAAGSTGVMTLGSKVYLRQNQLQMEVTPPLPLPKEWQFRLAGVLNNTAYARLEGFDAQWRETRATLRHHREDWLLQASASSVQDRARGQRPGGNRAGTFAGLQGRMNVGKGVIAEIGWQLQNWTGSRDYFPGLFDAPRLQRTRTWRASTTFALSAEHALVLEFRDTRNHENIPIFDYRTRTVQLNWQWQPRQMH